MGQSISFGIEGTEEREKSGIRPSSQIVSRRPQSTTSPHDKREARRNALVRMNDAPERDRVLGEFSASMLDSVGPVGADKGMAVLKEMNELGEGQEPIIRDGFLKINVL